MRQTYNQPSFKLGNETCNKDGNDVLKRSSKEQCTYSLGTYLLRHLGLSSDEEKKEEEEKEFLIFIESSFQKEMGRDGKYI